MTKPFRSKAILAAVIAFLVYVSGYGLLRATGVLVHQSNYHWPEGKRVANGYGHSITSRNSLPAVLYAPLTLAEEKLWRTFAGGSGEAH